MQERAALIFDCMANSTAAYEMAKHEEPDRSDDWTQAGSLWALANPKKGGTEDRWTSLSMVDVFMFD